MVKKSKGYRSRTRNLFSKKARESGKVGLSSLLYNYTQEEKVCIKVNPSYHNGMPHRRYHGKIGTIMERRGRSYLVKVNTKDKERTLIVNPEHLRPIKR